MKDKNENADPIQQSVHVDCPVKDAFRLFTEDFGKWWPLAEETCEIEPGLGGRVLERSESGAEHEWGTVTLWNPPDTLEFTWHPGGARDDCQRVSVAFEQEADGTKVTLTHRGWQFAGVTVCISSTEASPTTLVHGLAISWAPNWKPVAIGRDFAGGRLAGPIGFGKRATAWRNGARPTWAEVFANCFAAYAAGHAPDVLVPAGSAR